MKQLMDKIRFWMWVVIIIGILYSMIYDSGYEGYWKGKREFYQDYHRKHGRN